MKVNEAIKGRRSIRKFKDEPVSYSELEDLIEAARVAPSAANRQPLEYLIVDDPELEKEIFRYTEWAGYVEWDPSFEERPRAYILVLIDEDNESEWYKYDAGLAIENICLAAVAKGLGTCILGAIDREAIAEILKIPDGKTVDLAVAIGVPDQKAEIDDSRDEDIKYWVDKDDKFHVPKRDLEEFLYRNEFEK